MYKEVVDYIAMDDLEGNFLRKMIILLASFTVAPRYLFQNYQDAMEICR